MVYKRSFLNYLKIIIKPIIFSTNWELSQGLIFYKKYFKFSLITILHGLEVTRLKSKKYKKNIKNFKKTLSFLIKLFLLVIILKLKQNQ